MPDPLTIALRQLQAGNLRLPPQFEQSIRRDLALYGSAVDKLTVEDLVRQLVDGLKSVVHPLQEFRARNLQQGVTTGETPGSLEAGITKLLTQYEGGRAIAAELNLEFKIDVARKVTLGAGHYLTDQSDIDEYPAWEFHRIYDRRVPRGFRSAKGGLIEVPDENWPTRWAEAGEACGDDDWLDWEGDSQTGRGVALKSSGIWIQLGTIRDDTLGNPWAPFAFNSGFGTDGVPFVECVALGLIQDGDRPEPATIDFDSLIEIPD
jgi:hypothetical protein